jgi:hypothetical protein
MIVLNKTQIFGTGDNGDTKLIANIIRDTESQTGGQYDTWDYPTEESRAEETRQGAGKPEVLEVCEEALKAKCEGADGCGLLVGVVGQSSDRLASYRLKGFYGRNKLDVDTPRSVSSTRTRSAGDYFDYYWFVINEAALAPDADFQYQVSVGSDGTGDPDLYVSLVDGRFPTEADFDLVSNQAGADSVRIERYDNSTMWKDAGWEPRAGVVVVVGVRVDRPMNYTVALTRPPSAPESALLAMQRIRIGDA